MARGHHTSHHGKHHVSHHHEESAKVEHHHHAKGGKVEEEEHEGKMHDYTADSNVTKEAEEKGPTFNKGGRAKRARGGEVHHEGKHHVSHHHHEAAKVNHVHMNRGGHMKHVEGEGEKGRHRLDRGGRPGRKRGGGVGADMTPLTTAAKTRQAGAHSADNDELAHD